MLTLDELVDEAAGDEDFAIIIRFKDGELYSLSPDSIMFEYDTERIIIDVGDRV
jgi:hypothetical protein